MARILGIDYGTKRSGLAVTDPLQLIVTGLETVATEKLMDFLADYFQGEEVERVVVGKSLHKDGQPTDLHGHALGFVRKLKKQFPHMSIAWQDEFGTSREAKEIMLRGDYSQKKRRKKGETDRIAAILILQEYLGHR